MNIIEQIFKGKRFPAESLVPQSEEYKQASAEHAAATELLRGQLTEEQLHLLDDYAKAQVQMGKLLFVELFRKGVVLGAKLQRELLELE